MLSYTTLSVFTAPNVTLNSADTNLEAIDSVVIPPEVVRRRELASDLRCADTLYYYYASYSYPTAAMVSAGNESRVSKGRPHQIWNIRSVFGRRLRQLLTSEFKPKKDQ